MSDPRTGLEQGLDRDDAAFVRRIEESYRPEQLSPSRRVAFRAALDARIHRTPTRELWTVLATASAIALALVLLRVSGGPIVPTGAPAPVVAHATSRDPGAAAGDDTMLLALAMSDDSDDENDASLPDDYAAIADLFLEGV